MAHDTSLASIAAGAAMGGFGYVNAWGMAPG